MRRICICNTKKNYMHTHFIALYVVIHPQQQSQTKSKILCRKEDVYTTSKKMMTTTKNTGVKTFFFVASENDKGRNFSFLALLRPTVKNCKVQFSKEK